MMHIDIATLKLCAFLLWCNPWPLSVDDSAKNNAYVIQKSDTVIGSTVADWQRIMAAKGYKILHGQGSKDIK